MRCSAASVTGSGRKRRSARCVSTTSKKSTGVAPLDGLEDGGGSLAHAAADGGEAESTAPSADLERRGAHQPRPRGADRMPQRTGATVRVDVRIVDDPELAHEGDRGRGE